jgi:glucuronoarabinoxylan endo-1,4-beta-xylanase
MTPMIQQKTIGGRIGAALLFCGVIFQPQIHAQTTFTATLYLDSVQQIIRGYGAANIIPWRPDMTAAQIQTAFGLGQNQLGFTLLRIRVPYAASDFALNVATAQAAYAMGVTIVATPWTPPPAMKTINNIAGGELSDTAYASYAAHLKSFADFMSDNGAPLYAISVQNEPDANVTYESCYWNATQFLNFMKYNAPAIGIKVMMPESENFKHSLSDSTLNDSTAAAHVAFVAGHLYGGGLSSYPLATSKGKELWMTEWLNTDTSWAAVLATGTQISDCMSAGMSAYIWWYIVRYYGPIDENGVPTKRGFVMSQFSRFIRPGFVRVFTLAAGRGNPAYITAYKSDSKIVIVAINTASSPTAEQFNLQNLTGGAAIFKRYVTSQTKNLIEGDDIAVSDGSFTDTLEASSITTFVADATTGVTSTPTVPQAYTLSQNYPNPFNPTTRIEYTVPRAGDVSLKVYNLLGQEVATLFEGMRQPGRYEATFNASGLPSGVYFYQLRAGNFMETKKLLLLK